MRFKYILTGLAVMVLIPIVGGAWWLLSPLFTATTVDEKFPYAARAVVPSDMTRDQVERQMAALAPTNNPVTEAMPPAMTAPAVPLLLKTGRFQDADRFHRGSGLAEVFQAPDGTHLLRLEDFQVTNGPDLHVILTPHLNPQHSDEVKTPGYVDLGALKGNQGNQNYPLPAGLDPGEVGSVVIYCLPFQVIFSVAPLLAAP